MSAKKPDLEIHVYVRHDGANDALMQNITAAIEGHMNDVIAGVLDEAARCRPLWPWRPLVCRQRVSTIDRGEACDVCGGGHDETTEREVPN